MEEYESLVHLPRWRRIVIWFCEDRLGLSILSLTACALMFGPAYWLGWWWVAVILALWVGFAFGYNTARFWALRGDVPPKL